MNDDSVIWAVVRKRGGAKHNWETHGELHHIYDARKILADKPKGEGWEILHGYGDYPPGDWVGNPNHSLRHNVLIKPT